MDKKEQLLKNKIRAIVGEEKTQAVYDLVALEREMVAVQINNLILGYTSLGFINKEIWGPFIKTYFIRSGESTTERGKITYTAEQNEFISTVAMLQVLDEVYTKIKRLYYREADVS